MPNWDKTQFGLLMIEVPKTKPRKWVLVKSVLRNSTGRWEKSSACFMQAVNSNQNKNPVQDIMSIPDFSTLKFQKGNVRLFRARLGDEQLRHKCLAVEEAEQLVLGFAGRGARSGARGRASGDGDAGGGARNW